MVEAHGLTSGLALRDDPAVGRGAAIVWRAIDLLVAGVLLLLLVPLFLLLALAIKIDSPGPVIFRQRRVGQGLRRFSMRKLRTMRSGCGSSPHREYVTQLIETDAGKNGGSDLYKLAEDPRVTRVGRFLRRWSLDELPQLWNVLRGEMSLVGPRPAIPYELEMYEQAWYERFTVKPGITGLWQVSGRSRLTFREMIGLDLDYVEKRSVWLNIRILARTVRAVSDGKGAG
jgi:lipopolysaccharide/colanic/teichoic acid biosynthesis glycosyltransferase